MSHPPVQARGLGVQLGGRWLLQGLNLEVAAGERVAVVGHNGAGKSTLLQVLSGFRRPSAGQLQVLDHALHEHPTERGLRTLRAQLAQVHQGLHLVARLSALDNVLVGAAGRCPAPWTWARRWPCHEREAALAALARVGLAALAERRVDTLSGGERQKVAIARALLQGGPLLLADEPTASLDPDAAEDLAQLLGQVAKERGVALICVLHDLERIPLLADRVLVLRQGQLVADHAARAVPAAELRNWLR